MEYCCQFCGQLVRNGTKVCDNCGRKFSFATNCKDKTTFTSPEFLQMDILASESRMGNQYCQDCKTLNLENELDYNSFDEPFGIRERAHRKEVSGIFRAKPASTEGFISRNPEVCKNCLKSIHIGANFCCWCGTRVIYINNRL